MKRTQKHLENIRQIMNTNPAIQSQMDILAEKAVEKGITVEQWEELKIKIMSTMLYKMAEKIPEIKADLCKDIYEELRA